MRRVQQQRWSHLPPVHSSLLSVLFALLLGLFSLESQAAAPPSPPEVSPYDVIDQYANVLYLIENTYVSPVDRRRLLQGAIKGMVRELDPHSAFLPPKEFREFQADTRGEFVGIGIEVDLRDGAVRVLSPIEGSPAQKAGLKPADMIVAIDDWPVNDRPLEQIVRRIRGPEGSKVSLLVRRKGHKNLLRFTIVRHSIHVPSVRHQLLAKQVGYLQIKQFQEGTIEEFLAALSDLQRNANGKLRGIILDLRTNPGGLVIEAAFVADELLSHGIIYTTRARRKIIDEVQATRTGAAQTIPLVVMVNPLTASAAELLAASLQDNARALVVGQRSYGKGSVQSIYSLPGGCGLKITTMLYYSPHGRALQANGVTPDIIVNIPHGPTPSLPIQREENLDGHLQLRNTNETDHDTAFADQIVIPSGASFNPLKGTDPTLKRAYQALQEQTAP